MEKITEIPLNNKLLLASSSPRRQELISYLFKNTQIIRPEFEEPAWTTGHNFKEYLRACLRVKWSAAQNTARSHAWTRKGPCALLVADTIVVLKGQVFGKPNNEAEAVWMLGQLAGRSHVVATGVVLGWAGRQRRFIEQTQVRFHDLSAQEIRDYVATGEAQDKAGAYGFQGQGVRLVARVRGSYTNVIGLPLERLGQEAVKLME